MEALICLKCFTIFHLGIFCHHKFGNKNYSSPLALEIRINNPCAGCGRASAFGCTGSVMCSCAVVVPLLFNLSLCMNTQYLIFCQICSPYQKHPPYSCSFNTTFTIQANPLASYTLAVALLPSLFEFVHFSFFPKACLIHDKVFARNLTLRV